jgi:hypothetical protein
LNLRPSGYEPDELPDCSTPRLIVFSASQTALCALCIAPAFRSSRSCSEEAELCTSFYKRATAQTQKTPQTCTKNQQTPPKNQSTHDQLLSTPPLKPSSTRQSHKTTNIFLKNHSKTSESENKRLHQTLIAAKTCKSTSKSRETTCVHRRELFK